jgi:tetratricopeptide (TPR) repeat protein
MADLPPGQQTRTIDQALDLAVEHHNAGRLPEAESIYQQILQADPNQPAALNLLGVIARQVGKNTIAVELITKALTIKPNYAEAQSNLGNAYRDLKKLDEAVASYRAAIAINPNFADAYNNLGLALQGLGKLEEAVASYHKALAIEPNFAAAHNNLGLAQRDLAKLEEAMASYHKALVIQPDFTEAHNNLGNALTERGKLDDAVASYTKALSINPDYVEAHNNLGNALRALGKLDEAVTSYRTALSLKPDFAEAHDHLGVVLKDLGKLDKAVTSFHKALAIKPDYPEAHLNLSIASHLQGKLKEGWEEYEWRLKSIKSAARIMPIEMWSGSSLQGKSILVYAEQGIGDEIMFASCIPDLLERSPSKLILECAPRLEELFARSFPRVQVHGKAKNMDLSWLGENVQPNYALPLGSLPKFFRNRVEDFPKRDAYLTPHPKLIENWKQRLASLKEGLKIGISWRGGTEANVIKRASIPLPEWRSLLSMNASFINLQYGDVTKEIAKLGDLHIHDWDDNNPLEDLDNQAALISCLDLVITIDNATVHMCGAVGTRTWALLEQVPDWRWPEAFGDSTPLYQSVRLYRQKRIMEWGDVMERVAQDLKILVGNDDTH